VRPKLRPSQAKDDSRSVIEYCVGLIWRKPHSGIRQALGLQNLLDLALRLAQVLGRDRNLTRVC